jgi:NodT family efflux transporter outer membrane factor (OMF) lipoprotein
MQSDRISHARPLAPRALTIAVTAALATLLSACVVGPDYKRPAAEVPASFKEAAPGWKVAEPADQHDRGDWWTIYEDPQLNALEDKLNTANQTVAQFAATYRQARALVGEARAAYFPTIGASAGATRSGNGSQTGGNSTTATSRSGIGNSFNVQLDASWEPDLWGSVTRSVNAQKAGQQGAAADLANARLSAQATLAQTYFSLRSLDSTQKLLDDTVAAYQRSLQLTQNQYAAGVAARSDVIQAQTQLQSAQAAAIDNGIQRAQDEHAIAVLIGVPASVFTLAPMPLTATPPAVPAQMPSALLERRPDVASAERKAAAANEQIGVAIAAFFPSLTVSATGGFENSVFSQLLTVPSRFWTVGPQLAATLFDAGLRKAQTEAARATYDANVATYRQTVLAAFQDVEDNLASLRILEQEIVVQRQAVESARQALAIVTNEYKAGTVGFVNVLTAQTTAFTAEQKLESIAGQRMVSSVGLVKALGGGWDASQMNRETGDVAAPAPLPAASAVPVAQSGATPQQRVQSR